MSLTSEDLKAIADLIDTKLEPINERLDTIEKNTKTTREATNKIIKWINFYFGSEKPFPVQK